MSCRSGHWLFRSPAPTPHPPNEILMTTSPVYGERRKNRGGGVYTVGDLQEGTNQALEACASLQRDGTRVSEKNVKLKFSDKAPLC